MMRKALFQIVVLLSFLLLNFELFAQQSNVDDIVFYNALKDFVNKNLIKYGKSIVSRERFLVQQMRMLNSEIKSRVTNVNDIKDNYFKGLQDRIQEIRALRSRLDTSPSSSLITFLDDLERRIQQTVDEGRIDFQRQKVFEDGLQLMYIAEEMHKLDPGARFEENPKIIQGLQNSKQQFLNTFGDIENADRRVSHTGDEGTATIFNLFQEWKKTNNIKYEARWTDVQVVKNKLLRNSTAAQKDLMFKRELRVALMSYNFRNFDLADRLFEEILTRYDFVSTVDDIYYYKGESNLYLGRYESAKELYLKIIKEFPASSFVANAYGRLVKIYHHFGDPAKVSDYYNAFKNVANVGSDLYDETLFTTALSAISVQDYERAINMLSQIQSTSEFYIDAQYLIAQSYASALNFDDAERIYLSIINNHSVSPDYRFNVLLKLGYIKFEKREYPFVIKYLDQIEGSFSLYDRVLIAYGWSYYKIELQNPDNQTRDFTLAKKYLELLVDYFYTSDYYLEGKSLLGYIYQLEFRTEKAIDEYDYVFRSKHTKNYSDQLIVERDSLKKSLSESESITEKALIQNNKEAYFNAKNIRSRLENSYNQVSYRDFSPGSGAAKEELNRVHSQIKELDRLKALAIERDNQYLVDKIESLTTRLYRVVNEFPVEKTVSKLGFNYFDLHPSARKESVVEDQNEKVISMREDALLQKEKISARIIDLSADIAKAKASKDYKRLVQLEIQRERFEEIKKKLDYYTTFAYNLEVKDTPISLQKWSDYGAFGIANVNFEVKKFKREKRSYYAEQIQKINQILNSRKSILDHKIKLIEDEINLMTRKVRRQERLREREDLNRKFEESYFDTHTTEQETSTTEPPVFNEEEEDL